MHLEPRILFLKVTGESPSPSGFEKVATFDLAFGDALTFHELRLIRAPNGAFHAYPADLKSGVKSADLAPAFRDKIAELAVNAMESQIVRTQKA